MAGDIAMPPEAGGTVSNSHVPPDGFVDLFWLRVREEAEAMTAEKEELLDAFIHESVLKWESLEDALAAHLAGEQYVSVAAATGMNYLFRMRLYGWTGLKSGQVGISYVYGRLDRGWSSGGACILREAH